MQKILVVLRLLGIFEKEEKKGQGNLWGEGPEKGVVTKGVFSLEESLESLPC